MRVLSIDSSTEAASCAVIEDNRLLGEMIFNNEKQHSVILMQMVDQLLSSLHLTVNELDGFVISKGPGSFTGLRIGMATAKGLAMGSGKPCVSVSSLDSLAYNLLYAPGVVCPILDALRENVYTCLYSYSESGLTAITEYTVLSIHELADLLKSHDKPVYFIGDASDKYKEYFTSKLKEVHFAPPHLNITRASSLGELGLKLIKSGYTEDINISTPIYLRKSQAEREYEKKMETMGNE